MTEKNKSNQVLIIGAGITGIKASLELAETGIKVYLCDRNPDIGGALFTMDRWFPDNQCEMCKTFPFFTSCETSQLCLRRGLNHPNIEFIPSTTIKKVSGAAGDFTVSLEQDPLFVNPDKCTGCGLCEKICPVETVIHTGGSTINRKAVYLNNPQMLRKVYTIDHDHCTRCDKCVNSCPTGAIDFSCQPVIREIEAGAIILSTGFEEFDPLTASQYGYRRYPNVITSIEMEKMLSETGTTGGKIIRPSDHKIPQSIAFIQCVGSRDLNNGYCSSVCCMYAIKESIMIKQKNPDININIFYMDMRTFGKGCERYFNHATDEMGICFTRSRIPVIKQDFSNNDLLLNNMNDHGEIITERFELAVLSIALKPSRDFAELSNILNIKTNKWGFASGNNLSMVGTDREGIFVCGSASGPKDIAESITEAEAAALMASKLLSTKKQTSVLTKKSKQNSQQTAVFICNCKGQLSELLDTSELTRFAGSFPGIKISREFDHLCNPEQHQLMQNILLESGADRAVIAACSIFRPVEMIEDIPVNPINIREEIAWVHNKYKAATEKSKVLLTMAVENAKWRNTESTQSPAIVQKAIIIGGGLAGLTTAQSIAEQGIEIDLIEKTGSLGGNMKHIYFTLDQTDIQKESDRLIEIIKSNPLIHLHTDTIVESISGNVGRFSCIIRDNSGNQHNIEAGTVILATGADVYEPQEYCFGKTESIITQRTLEKMVATSELELLNIKSLVMIQCVGSRDKDRPYCSRICCSQALKNALVLKNRYPQMSVTVLYRDMMSYGFMEEYYTKARESGVLFLRHDMEHKPEVDLIDGSIVINTFDSTLDQKLTLNPDMVVLSTAIVAGDSNTEIAKITGIELTPDNFFREAEEKFRPVNSTREGIYICGLAHSPRNIKETILQAQAVAQNVISLLKKENLRTVHAIAEVIERKCSGCELCIPACPYNARVKNPLINKVSVIGELCQGCGACAAVCPNGAAVQKEFTGKEVLSLLDLAI